MLEVVENVQESFWYALQVKPRFERAIGNLLAAKGKEVFVPVYRTRRRWVDRSKELELALFPGYVFCRFDPLVRLPILVTPGVMRIVGHGKQPVPVDTDEIEAIKLVVRSGLAYESTSYVRAGQRVRFIHGALKGVEGVVLEIRKRLQVVLSVELLQRSVAVEVHQEWIEPVAGSMHLGAAQEATGPSVGSTVSLTTRGTIRSRSTA